MIRRSVSLGMICGAAALLVGCDPVTIKVDLPPPPKPEPVMVTLQSGGRVLIEDKLVTHEALVPQLKALVWKDGEQVRPIMLKADNTVSYTEFSAVLNRLQGAKFLRIGLLGSDAEP